MGLVSKKSLFPLVSISLWTDKELVARQFSIPSIRSPLTLLWTTSIFDNPIGHCWRSRDELISDVLLWTPTHGCAKAGRPAQTYIQQLCEDSGCCPEDLPGAMNEREEWRERVGDIRATSKTWWWLLNLDFNSSWLPLIDEVLTFKRKKKKKIS